METEGRSPTDPVSLYNRLSEAPWEHDFFQALRRIDAEGEKPRLGTSVRLSDDPIRLGQQPDCAFAPSTLATVAAGRDGNPPRLDVLFFGLTGPNGPLPLHLTEYARERQRNLGDPTFKRFLDIFHHRLLTLFYRAWAEARPTVSFDRPDDDVFQQWVGALSGRGFDSLRNPEGPSPTATRFYTGHLAAQTRYKEGLVGILSDYLQLPVEIEEFVGHWLDIPDATRLGQLGSTLGVDCCIGTQVWDRQHKIRIRIGPLDYLDFDHLLPHGEALAEIGAWIREYLGEELDWDLNLVLKLSDIPGTPLGGGQRLGWSTWLGTAERDSDDLLLAREHSTAKPRAQTTNSTRI